MVYFESYFANILFLFFFVKCRLHYTDWQIGRKKVKIYFHWNRHQRHWTWILTHPANQLLPPKKVRLHHKITPSSFAIYRLMLVNQLAPFALWMTESTHIQFTRNCQMVFFAGTNRVQMRLEVNRSYNFNVHETKIFRFFSHTCSFTHLHIFQQENGSFRCRTTSVRMEHRATHSKAIFM